MVLKSVVLLLWFAASYVGLVFAAQTAGQAALLSISLALAMAGISFAVQHDGNHGAYSKHAPINRLMGLTLDLLGASSYIWQWKHNIAHHTYTGLNGADFDIDVPFGRLTAAQPHRPMHRFQHLYLWPIYGLFVANWQLYQDFRQLAEARIANSRFPRPRGWRLVEFWAGKVLFFGWAFALPMCLHPWWVVGRRDDPTRLGGAQLRPGARLSARAQRRGGGAAAARCEHAAGAAGLGRAPGQRDGRFCARQPPALLVRRRSQLPDRAPPLGARTTLPRPGTRSSPRSCSRTLRRVRRALSAQSRCVARTLRSTATPRSPGRPPRRGVPARSSTRA